jgi:3-oxoacyl-[acyl-carrier-protein] synthase-3
MPETLTAPRSSPPARSPRGAGLGSVGVALPETVVTNESIARRLGVDDRWIMARTGVSERRVAAPTERMSDLAAAAGARALERSALTGDELDHVLVATTSQDELMPGTAPLVAHALGAVRAAATDVGAACTGFVAGLDLGAAQIESGRADAVLVIGADLLTRFCDPGDKRTAALFGDGAGAVVMTPTDAGRVGPVLLWADGSEPDLFYADRTDAVIRMKGHETFQRAVARLSAVTEQAAAEAGLALNEIDLFVYHQANRRILAAVGDHLGLSAERVVDCIARYGNTSAASIPLALREAEADGRLVDGARVLIAAFGAGFTWGGVVVEWGHGAAPRPTPELDAQPISETERTP